MIPVPGSLLSRSLPEGKWVRRMELISSRIIAFFILSLAFNELPCFAQETLGFGIAGPRGLVHDLAELVEQSMGLLLVVKLKVDHAEK